MSSLTLMKNSHDAGLVRGVLSTLRGWVSHSDRDLVRSARPAPQHTHGSDRTWQLLLQTPELWRYL